MPINVDGIELAFIFPVYVYIFSIYVYWANLGVADTWPECPKLLSQPPS